MAKAKKKAAEEKEPRRTIMALVREIFTEDPEVSTQDVIDQVKEEFPDSKINKAHVGWYRSKLREEGIDIPRRRRVAAKEEEPKATKKKKKKKKAARK
jgi:hypothetical protein